MGVFDPKKTTACCYYLLFKSATDMQGFIAPGNIVITTYVDLLCLCHDVCAGSV